MTKSQLIAHLAEQSGMSKKDVARFWDILVASVYSEVKGAGAVTLPGLGKMVMQKRAARMGRNPATGEQIQIPAKTVCKFRVAKAAKEAVLS